MEIRSLSKKLGETMPLFIFLYLENLDNSYLCMFRIWEDLKHFQNCM